MLVALQKNGRGIPVSMPAEGTEPTKWTFASGELRIVQGDHEERAVCTVDTSTEPPRITICPAGLEVGTVQGIFRRAGDKLTICVSEEGQPLPSDIPSVPGTGWTVYHLRALAHQ